MNVGLVYRVYARAQGVNAKNVLAARVREISMNSQEIYQKHGQEVYLFILKRVKNKCIAHDVFQNAFLKIHKKIQQLKADSKVRAWVFQIVRNEIVNYFNQELSYQSAATPEVIPADENSVNICCFDRFIDELPDTYKEVMLLTYVSGKKQEQVAKILDISISNVKTRIRRSKEMLKEKFLACCKFEVNFNGKLIGTPDCPVCK